MDICSQYVDFVKRSLYFFLVFSFFPFISYSQGIKVSDLKMLKFDLSASTNIRLDSLGTPCGLVKVRVDDPDLRFEGNVVGLVENKVNEYWVYLSAGTQKLVVKRNQYLPLKVNFKEYGIDSIGAKETYLLQLKETSLKPEKNSLVINVTPKTAVLSIDGIEMDNGIDGNYMVLLEKGEHVCRITAVNYMTKTEIINAGKAPLSLNVELESLMADVIIDCETTDAELFVNNVKIGSGVWEGCLPAGDYTLEARKKGCITQETIVSLAEKEKRTITLPKLTRKRFPLYIKTSPSKCFNRNVKLDGASIGRDSVVMALVSAGNHTIEIEITGCNKIKENKYIESTDTLVYDLYPKTDAYKAAYQNGIIDLLRMTQKTYGDESFFWGDMVCNQLFKLENKDIVNLCEKNVSDWTFLIDHYFCSQERRHIAYTLLEKFESCNVDANFLAKNYYNMKDFEKALPWYLKSLKSVSYESVPSLSDKYYTIGICYKELGNYLKAIDFCNKAEKVYSGYVPPKEFLGECYLHIGNKNMAIKWFRAALKCYIEGNFFGREQFLERMKSIGLHNAVVEGIL